MTIRDPNYSQPALLVAGMYLLLTLPLVLWGTLGPSSTGQSVAGLGAHVAALVLLVWMLWWNARMDDGVRGPPPTAHLLPLILMAAAYAELPLLMAAAASLFTSGGAPAYHDVLVMGWERRIFGGEPARATAPRFDVPVLSAVLHASYLSYYPLIFVPPALLWWRGLRRELGETVFAVTSVFAACFVVFIVFPVQGPRYVWPPTPNGAADPIRALALRVLAAGSSRGAAFPSSHVAVALAQALAALRHQRRVGVVCLAITLGIAVGAVYGGFHYAVDVVAGTAVGAVVTVLAMGIFPRLVSGLVPQALVRRHVAGR